MGITITSEALARGSAGIDSAEVLEGMNQLCHLLSLARGTSITWTSAEATGTSGTPTYIVLKYARTWPFSTLTLIDPRDPNETASFIDQVYPAYLKLRVDYNLDVAIDQYLDAKRSTAYLETRALAAVALIDSLQYGYAIRYHLSEIVSGFGKNKHAIRENLAESIRSAFPDIRDEELTQMLEKIPELNRRSFLSLLKLWTHGLGFRIADSELVAVRDTRNSLTHTMRFRSSDDGAREYFRLVNLINEAFLRLLGYRGHFIHVDLETLAFGRRGL